MFPTNGVSIEPTHSDELESGCARETKCTKFPVSIEPTHSDELEGFSFFQEPTHRFRNKVSIEPTHSDELEAPTEVIFTG